MREGQFVNVKPGDIVTLATPMRTLDAHLLFERKVVYVSPKGNRMTVQYGNQYKTLKSNEYRIV